MGRDRSGSPVARERSRGGERSGRDERSGREERSGRKENRDASRSRSEIKRNVSDKRGRSAPRDRSAGKDDQQSKDDAYYRGRGRGEGHDVVVRNLPRQIDEEQLRYIFKGFGNILTTSIPKDYRTGNNKDFGFVKFDDERGADKAAEKMNDAEVDGATVTVERARGGRKSANEMATRREEWNSKGGKRGKDRSRRRDSRGRGGRGGGRGDSRGRGKGGGRGDSRGRGKGGGRGYERDEPRRDPRDVRSRR